MTPLLFAKRILAQAELFVPSYTNVTRHNDEGSPAPLLSAGVLKTLPLARHKGAKGRGGGESVLLLTSPYPLSPSPPLRAFLSGLRRSLQRPGSSGEGRGNPGREVCAKMKLAEKGRFFLITHSLCQTNPCSGQAPVLPYTRTTRREGKGSPSPTHIQPAARTRVPPPLS